MKFVKPEIEIKELEIDVIVTSPILEGGDNGGTHSPFMPF